MRLLTVRIIYKYIFVIVSFPSFLLASTGGKAVITTTTAGHSYCIVGHELVLAAPYIEQRAYTWPQSTANPL